MGKKHFEKVLIFCCVQTSSYGFPEALKGDIKVLKLMKKHLKGD